MLDEQTPIEEVGTRLFTGDRTHILDGFIVTREGRYLGVGTGVTLTRALTDLTVARARIAVQESVRQNSAKNQFIAKVSHEIRTPLNGVIGIVELLHRTTLSSEQQELVGLLRLSGQALMGLVDEVLDYSKIAASKLELERVPFDFRALVDETVRILGVRAGTKDIRIHCNLDAALPARLVGDPTCIRQVLLNLGGNAVKFTERGHVTFHVRVEPVGGGVARVAVHVEDTGIGIPHNKRDLLFIPFSQADTSTSRQYGGSGLGLAISQEIVQKMGRDHRRK